MAQDTIGSIRRAVADEMFRICCFLIYYVVLMVLGVGIFVGALYLTFDLAVIGLAIGAWLFTLLAIIGLWTFVVMFGLYLVKPLFSFKKDENDSRVGVEEADCPELFAMLRDVAEKTRCKMPKHVFLSPDVNACVFYDTSFWSIFFPVRKNLEIGLGLFDGTSVEEVKAIIAHEFGHFSQNSMKVGSGVYVTNTILHDLVFGRDFWDEKVDSICRSGYSIIRCFGKLTRWLSDRVRAVTVLVYKYVQKGYLRLSRYMEYDADDIATQCVGKDVFVSALCKVEVMSEKDGLYKQLLQSLTQEKKIVSGYFTCKSEAYRHLSGTHTAHLSYDVMLDGPKRRFYYVPSKIKMENVWASHPSLEDRIANVDSKGGGIKSSGGAKPAWTLVPDDVAGRVSANCISIIENNTGERLTHISDGQFSEWVQAEIRGNFMDERLVPFFSGNIYEFDINHADNSPAVSPFTRENAIKIAKLTTGINDYNLLVRIRKGEVEADDVEYDGIIYDRKHLPIDELKAKLDVLYAEVLRIYSDICAYVKSRTLEGEMVRTSFSLLFYAKWINNVALPHLVAHRNAFVDAWNRVAEVADDEDYELQMSLCGQYENAVKEALSKMSLHKIEGIEIVKPYADYLQEYLRNRHNVTQTLDGYEEPIKCVYYMQKALYNATLRHICDAAKAALDNPLPCKEGMTGAVSIHEAVDLGLSVKWATCNVGASVPSDYGFHYAWGEKIPKSSYVVDNCETIGKTLDGGTKCIGDIGGTDHDVARAKWGGAWRLPAKDEFDELWTKCTWTKTTLNGVNGYKVTGSNGNSIFLPAAGLCAGTSLNDAGNNGVYWTSTPDDSDSNNAYGLLCSSDIECGLAWYCGTRAVGLSVRPVTE